MWDIKFWPLWIWRLLYSGMWCHVVWYKVGNVSEKYVCFHLHSWCGGGRFQRNTGISVKFHSFTTQRTVIFELVNNWTPHAHTSKYFSHFNKLSLSATSPTTSNIKYNYHHLTPTFPKTPSKLWKNRKQNSDNEITYNNKECALLRCENLKTNTYNKSTQ
jgi:hypothetical protein